MTQPPQAGPGPNPYGQQPGAPHSPYGQPVSPMGTVALTIQGSVLTSSMLTPSVTINGHPIRTQYGRQDIPVPAGPVHVEASAQWMRTYGQAALDFTLAPGQAVPVFYVAPMHQFTTGSIGHQEQKRRGLGVMLGVMLGIIVVVVALFVGLALIAALM